MAATWGYAEIQVTVDGKGLVPQMEALTKEVGAIGGRSMGESFNKSFGQRVKDGIRTAFGRFTGFFKGLWGRLFKRGGKTVGDGFTDGFKESIKSFKLEFDKVSTDVVRQSQEMARSARDVDFGRWADDFGRFRQVFKEIGGGQLALPAGSLEDIGELRQVFDDVGDSAKGAGNDFRILWRELEAGDGKVKKQRKSLNLLNRAWTAVGSRVNALGGGGGFFKKLWDSMDDGEGRLGRHASLWKRLSANTRQWTLIIGAVIGGMSELAGLGAAAGAGIFVLGSAIGSLILGGALLVPIFNDLNTDLKDLPESLRPAAKAFQGIGDAFQGIGKAVETEALKNAPAAFDTIAASVKALTPAFKPLAKVIGSLITEFADNTKPGTDFFKEMSKFAKNSAPIFGSLARSAGKLVTAILRGFNRANPLTEKFVGWIGKLVDSFDAFTKSDDFDTWIDHATDVFGAFGDLLDTTGTLLNDMVTDESIGQLVDFIEHIEGFLSGGGAGILDFAQKLDVFGILADALDTFGEALEPLAVPMADFAEGLNAVLSSTIDTLAPIIEDVAEALAPFVEAIGDFMKENPKQVGDILLSIAAGFLAIKAVGIISSILPGIKGFVGLMSGKNTTKTQKFAAALGGLAIAFTGLSEENSGTDALTTALGGAVTGSFAGLPGILIGALAGFIASMINDVFLTPDVQGAWESGWDQIFNPDNFTGAGIGPLKHWFQNEFVDFFTTIDQAIRTGIQEWWANIGRGFEESTGFIGDAWANVVAAFSLGWEQIVNFFTVSVPGFFTGLWNNITAGFATLLAIIALNFLNTKKAFETGWQAVVTFFTVTIPKFFSDVVRNFGLGFQSVVTGVGTWFGKIATEFKKQFDSLLTKVGTWVTNIANRILNGFGGIPLIGQIASLLSGNGMASGGTVFGPQRRLIGEAGPEAVVPLNRPLSQVSPDVRWLSAIAQGKSLGGMASGGVSGGGGRTVNLSPGAIQIVGPDARRAAIEVVNRLVEVSG